MFPWFSIQMTHFFIDILDPSFLQNLSYDWPQLIIACWTWQLKIWWSPHAPPLLGGGERVEFVLPSMRGGGGGCGYFFFFNLWRGLHIFPRHILGYFSIYCENGFLQCTIFFVTHIYINPYQLTTSDKVIMSFITRIAMSNMRSHTLYIKWKYAADITKININVLTLYTKNVNLMQW